MLSTWTSSGPGADHHGIVDGLRATTARIITDHANIGSPAGHTALVARHARLAMMGLQIDLEPPAPHSSSPATAARQRPASSLLDYSDYLLPGGRHGPLPPPM
ncbi:MAG TPA: hypothetical protein VIV12_16365 [Streptosporangiaceae bacterium]